MHTPQIPETSQTRPNGLSFLCILSFIGSGLSLFSHILIGLFHKTFLALLDSNMYDNIPGVNTAELQDVLISGGPLFFLVSAGLFALSLWGVYKIWHLQKVGIHYYAIAQISLVIIPLIFINRNMPVFGGLIISLLFILLYASYRKIMR